MPRHREKVIFMGSPEFAVPTLKALAAAVDFDVVCVVSQPDRERGRGRKRTPTPVKALAQDNGLTVVDMSKENYTEVAAHLGTLQPDFVVVAAFGLILKRELLALPSKGCINLHASLLPRHRGMSPVQAAILSGDAETGVTTMFMDEGVDTGDMLLMASTAIADSDTAGRLEERLAGLGAPLVIETLRGLRAETIARRSQDDTGATYARRLRKTDGAIDWGKPAVAIWRRVRAMQPWPTAYTSFAGRRLIVIDAVVVGVPSAVPEIDAAASPGAPGNDAAAVESSTQTPGTVVSTSPLVVATGQGALELRRVKVAGKKETPADSFVSGYRIRVGDTLEPSITKTNS